MTYYLYLMYNIKLFGLNLLWKIWHFRWSSFIHWTIYRRKRSRESVNVFSKTWNFQLLSTLKLIWKPWKRRFIKTGHWNSKVIISVCRESGSFKDVERKHTVNHGKQVSSHLVLLYLENERGEGFLAHICARYPFHPFCCKIKVID